MSKKWGFVGDGTAIVHQLGHEVFRTGEGRRWHFGDASVSDTTLMLCGTRLVSEPQVRPRADIEATQLCARCEGRSRVVGFVLR